MDAGELNKSEKLLIAIGELSNSKTKVTVEDVAVKLWEKYPQEFCMKGYPQYPNVDIQKYVTKLLTSSLVTGGVFNYTITEKGKERLKELNNVDRKNSKTSVQTTEISRHVRSEIQRIASSKIYKYYLQNQKKSIEVVESDFFEFIGSSSRSMATKNNSIFMARYNTITKDVIPFCEKNKSSDPTAKNIALLWNILLNKFSSLIGGG